MAITLLQQETQIRRSLVADIDDTVAPSEANMETNPVSLLDDLNNLRSLVSNLLDGQAGNWYDDLNTPSALETGSQRGVNDLNSALHDQEKARRLVPRKLLVDISVAASENWVILGTGELPSQTTAAVGAVTTKGTVVAAHGGTFGTHALSEVAGAHALAPKNLLEITDAGGDPILSGGRRIWGLLQGESGLTDGGTITDTTTTRVQISFVRPNAAHTDLEACPVADIESTTIRYCYVERIAHDELTEQDFLARGAAIDIGAGAGTVDRQTAYDNQGATPVDLTTAAILDLEGAGLAWRIRDDLEATLFEIIEGSAGGTSQVNIAAAVDEFDVDAVVNDFNAGVTVNSGGTRPIAVGVTDGEIASTAGDLMVRAAAELLFDDGNQTGSTWAQDGIKLSETTQEWDDFETAFGEVSLLNAITQAKNLSGRRRVFAVVTAATIAADADVSGPSNDNNIDADLGDLSAGTFVDDYDFYVNGAYQRPGADASANFDVYPGTALSNGQVRFEHRLFSGDTIAMIDLAG